MGDMTHKDHRQRMKERFLKNGMETLHDHEVIEMLLYYSVQRIDTNPIAHRLMEKFGSLHAVLEATPEALKSVKGVGESTVVLIEFFRQLMNRYAVDKEEQDLKFASMDNSDKIGRYLKPRFMGKTEEILLVMATDVKGKVLGVEEISRGSIRTTNVNIRKIVEFVIKYNAAAIILAHNHPGGLAMPSDDDITTTRRMQDILRPMEIIVRDHIIVADDGFISLKDSGMMNTISIIGNNITRNPIINKNIANRCASDVIDIIK